MEAVLVTGGAGYIGSHVAKRLARAGMLPVVLDNLSTGNRWAVRWGPLIEADIEDANAVRRAVTKHDIKAAIHLAASAYVGESLINPRKYFDNNVIAGLTLFETLLDCKVDKVVLSSTCAVYGEAKSDRIDETHPRCPVNPYGESKLFLEKALSAFDVAYGLRSLSLRYFNAAGADPEGEIGESHDPEPHLIPQVIRTALGIGESVSVLGHDYPTRDGSAIRDYTHVADLAEAHVLALRCISRRSGSLALNLGTGTGHSVLEVVKATETISGKRIPIRLKERRAGDPAHLVASAGAARKVLGWSPNYPKLGEMISHAWKWHLKQDVQTHNAFATQVMVAGGGLVDSGELGTSSHDLP